MRVETAPRAGLGAGGGSGSRARLAARGCPRSWAYSSGPKAAFTAFAGGDVGDNLWKRAMRTVRQVPPESLVQCDPVAERQPPHLWPICGDTHDAPPLGPDKGAGYNGAGAGDGSVNLSGERDG
jgi:hypothetical protein